MLTKLVEPRCPECGRGFDPNDSTTFDTHERHLRAGRACVWISIACSTYAVWVCVSMVATVVARFTAPFALADVVYIVLNISCVGMLLAVTANVIVLIAAPLAAGQTRDRLWVLWGIAVVYAITSFCFTALLFLFLMPALML